MSGTDIEVESLLRQLAPQVLGAVVRRYGNFDTAEERVAFTASPAFKANPSGISLDRDEFITRYRAGVSKADLLAL